MKLYLLLTGSLLLNSGETRKWVFRPVSTLGATTQATLYYGPWQCRAVWFEDCAARCAAQGRQSLGCVWLADLKAVVQHRFLFMPLSPRESRLALTHCCCDWPTQSPVDRTEWKNGADRFRDEWSAEYGAWPQHADGKHWDGHHIHDLLRGGPQLSRDNVIPVPSDVHRDYNGAYRECYAPGSRWSAPGPDYPYVD